MRASLTLFPDLGATTFATDLPPTTIGYQHALGGKRISPAQLPLLIFVPSLVSFFPYHIWLFIIEAREQEEKGRKAMIGTKGLGGGAGGRAVEEMMKGR